MIQHNSISYFTSFKKLFQRQKSIENCIMESQAKKLQSRLVEALIHSSYIHLVILFP